MNSKNYKKVLLIAYLNSHLNHLIRVAKLLKKTKNYFPVILFVTEFMPFDHSYQKILQKEKIDLIDIHGHNLAQSEPKIAPVIITGRKRSFLLEIWQLYLKFVNFIFWRRNYSFPLRYYRNIKEKIFIVEKLFRKIKPDLIILAEENTIYQTSIFTTIAKKYSIPSVIVPYTIANETEFAEALYQANEAKGFLNRLVGLFFPKWIYRYKGKNLILCQGWQVLILELLKLTSKRPWLINSGFANKIAVESLHMMGYYLKNGLPSEKLVLTGSLSDDDISKSQKEILNKKKWLVKKFSLDEKPIVLCAIPPFLPPRNGKTGFENSDQFYTFWIKSLLEIKNYNIIFNLHPNISNSQKKPFEMLGATVTSDGLAELIPLCDLYIACISATIRWAIACGKPVLNFDIYKFRYHDYDAAKGVMTVESKNDFIKCLRKFSQNRSYHQQMVEAQAKYKAEWGRLDGQSGRRMLDLLDDLTSNNEVAK